MKKCLCSFLFIIAGYLNHLQAKNIPGIAQKLCFIENKGQIKDQYGNRRNDVQYTLQARGITVFIGNGAMHYQFAKRDICAPDNTTKSLVKRNSALSEKNKSTNFLPTDIETYRMDVELIGANKDASAISGEPQAYYENYYLPGCPVNGIHAHSYKKITYKNVFPDIDWVINIKSEKPEYEFVVRPGGDVSNIKVKYNGQTSLKINDDGSITAVTPMGVISEHAPVCYRADGSILASAFKLQGNVLSYNVGDYNGALVIDPVVEWGTYYGDDSSTTYIAAITCDNAGNVYGSGTTYSTVVGAIATAGAFQTVLAGISDAMLVKFDSSGNRIWGTYYGGTATDLATTIALDHSGNVYMGGQTNSDSSMTTSGTQEPVYLGGEWSGFLAKFDTSGYRKWGTYIGGTTGPWWDIEQTSICFDNFGHVYVSGQCDDTANISTPGCWKYIKTDIVNVYDCYLQQYDTNGIRIWGTYYGGSGNDVIGASCSDGLYVYLAGSTVCDTGISSPGSYQPSLYDSFAENAFIAKFDTAGNRVWGTYYGGEAQVTMCGITADNSENVYILGSTTCDSNMASPGCYQPLLAGGFDAYLARFNTTTGDRIWGTYYGGPGDEFTSFGTIIYNSGYLYIDGYTSSDSGIASPCEWQTVYGGGDYDAFLAKYSTDSGTQVWATYLGGSMQDRGWGCAFDGNAVYICGNTSSNNNIATPGSFLSTSTGSIDYMQGFLVKFVNPIPDSISGLTSICIDSTTILNDNIGGGGWSSSDTAVAIIDSATGLLTGLSAGITTITYTHSPGCFITISDTVKKCGLSVPEISNNNSVQIYPNPAQDELTVIATGKITDISISNVIGQCLYSNIYDAEKVQIFVGNLPDGLYIIKINYSITKNFVKQ